MEEVNGSRSEEVEVEQQPQEIPVMPLAWIAVPQPLPTDWRVGNATMADEVTKKITLEITTPGGKTIVFLDPPNARQLGAALIQHGQKATGLLVP